ncbi:MAG: phosphopantothenoylcysteine decarboxylase/phosphopantothenate--cysteine ligase [Parasphingorhabdus sp.]|jgi:phosphopantothenoylcysteine decarboxylase/phosphopantothenate--cysteine ligase
MNPLAGKNILVGIGGGIAAYKCAELVRRLKDAGAQIKVVMTQNSCEFITPLTMQAVSGQAVRTTLLDSDAENGMDHIELARWADDIIIAPTTANLAARIANGIADDLLTTLVLASKAQLWLAPAMNHVMWSKAATIRNFEQLVLDGARLIGPNQGDQACGESGTGRMSEPAEILATIITASIQKITALSRKKVLLTAGPTWEALDPVRGITNHSSGKMGFALASAFIESGAQVTLVSGPCQLPSPDGVEVIRVSSATEMLDAVLESITEQDIFVGVAAVADYRPVNQQKQKLKKQADHMTLELVRNPDILATVAESNTAPFCVGFAAETQNVESYALGKLKKKKLDMIAANLVGSSSGGFMSDDNALLVLGNDLRQQLGPDSKTSIARQLVKLIAQEYEKKNSG